MSNHRFIELSSSYRNRIQYPYPAEFDLPFSPPTLPNTYENIKGVYTANKVTSTITSKKVNYTDTVTNGIIEYLWSYPYDMGQFNNDGSTVSISSGTLTVSLPNPYAFNANYYKGSTILITDLSNNFVSLSTVTSSTYEYNNYVTVTFSPSMNIAISTTFNYTICIAGGNIATGSTISNIMVKGLTTSIVNFYVGYQLNIYSSSATVLSSSIITSYDPTTESFTIKIPLNSPPLNTMFFTITDPSTNSSIVIPGVDSIGQTALDYAQSYNGYYLMNETLSSGNSIVASKINSYDFLTRTLTLATPFSSWALYDKYSLRKTLPDEIYTTTTLPILSGTITDQTNANTIYTDNISGLSSNANYNGFQILLDGYPPNTILSCTQNNTRIVLVTSVILTTFPVAFTIIPTFSPVQIPRTYPYEYYPQLSIASNCIYLPLSANSTDNYYKGKYMYIYPNTNSSSSLTNIRGSCFYINAYIGNGYNACFITNVNDSCVKGETEFYPSYSNITANVPMPGTLINIVSFSKDNYTPLMYNGSVASQNEPVAYEISLVNLTLPNTTLISGSSIVYYPYVYVEFTILNSQVVSAIYSNNPNSKKAMFLVPITDINNKMTTRFIKLNGGSMIQTVKFKPNDCLKFSVYLPNGELFKTVATDYYSPSVANPFVQIEAVFSILRLSGIRQKY